ncbi:MAG: hypothetical protein ACLR5S_11650 [Ruminococcus sp.]
MLDALLSSGKEVYIALRIDIPVWHRFPCLKQCRKMLRLKHWEQAAFVETERAKRLTDSSQELGWLNQHVFRNTLPTGDAPHGTFWARSLPRRGAPCSAIRRLLAQDTHCAAGMLPSCPTRCPIIRVLWKRQWNYALPYYMDEKGSMCIRRFWYICIHLGLLQNRRNGIAAAPGKTV